MRSLSSAQLNIARNRANTRLAWTGRSSAIAIDQRDGVALANGVEFATAPRFQDVDFEHALGVGIGAAAAIRRDVLA